MNNSEETYKIAEGDAMGWLEHARGILFSAEVIHAALKAMMPLSQTHSDIRVKKSAYMQSFMLLTALAFENVLKGIAVAENPTAWRFLKDDSGHGISTLAARCTTLSKREGDLLRRLQEYLVWAGRYTIPTKPTRYISNFNLLCLHSDDQALVLELFDRLSRILHERVHPATNTPTDSRYPLRGTPVTLLSPTEPVADADWETAG